MVVDSIAFKVQGDVTCPETGPGIGKPLMGKCPEPPGNKIPGFPATRYHQVGSWRSFNLAISEFENLKMGHLPSHRLLIRSDVCLHTECYGGRGRHKFWPAANRGRVWGHLRNSKSQQESAAFSSAIAFLSTDPEAARSTFPGKVTQAWNSTPIVPIAIGRGQIPFLNVPMC